MKDLPTIIGELRRLPADLRIRYPMREMEVFGPCVRAKQTHDSDIEALVDPDDGVALIDFAGRERALTADPAFREELAVLLADLPPPTKQTMTLTGNGNTGAQGRSSNITVSTGGRRS